jgi:hypothetical protein
MENTTAAILTGLGTMLVGRPRWPGWCGWPTGSPTAADQRFSTTPWPRWPPAIPTPPEHCRWRSAGQPAVGRDRAGTIAHLARQARSPRQGGQAALHEDTRWTPPLPRGQAPGALGSAPGGTDSLRPADFPECGGVEAACGPGSGPSASSGDSDRQDDCFRQIAAARPTAVARPGQPPRPGEGDPLRARPRAPHGELPAVHRRRLRRGLRQPDRRRPGRLLGVYRRELAPRLA